ncbi:hypothetical protein ACOME3_005802 [Neoechinorhynchus agilis]
MRLDPTILDDNMIVHSISRGSTLCREGDPATYVYLLLEGTIIASCISKDKPQRSRPIFIATADTLLGVLGPLTGETVMFTLKAKEKCRICVLTEKQINRLIRMEPDIVVALTQMEISRLSQFARTIDFTLDCAFIRAKKLAYSQDSSCPDNVYIILNGRVRMIASPSNPKSHRHMIGEHGRGEVIGFLEQFTQSRRQAAAMAVRDTEMIKIPCALLNYFKFQYSNNFSHFMRITNVLCPRPDYLPPYYTGYNSACCIESNEDPHFLLPKRNLHTVAVFPVSSNVPIDEFTSALAKIVSESGTSAIRLTGEMVGVENKKGDFGGFHEQNLSAWLSQLEEMYRLVIYQCSDKFDKWTTNVLLEWTGLGFLSVSYINVHQITGTQSLENKWVFFQF